MTSNLKFDITDSPPIYNGQRDEDKFNHDRILEFNHRHSVCLKAYDLEVADLSIVHLDDSFRYTTGRWGTDLLTFLAATPSELFGPAVLLKGFLCC